jgi:hypothetical protein
MSHPEPKTAEEHLPPASPMLKKLAERLIGTTDYPDELDDFTPQEAKQFDQLAFNCELCGWWFCRNELNIDEARGTWYCKECYDEQN